MQVIKHQNDSPYASHYSTKAKDILIREWLLSQRLGRDVFSWPVLHSWARTSLCCSASASAGSLTVLSVLTWMDAASGDTAWRRRPHLFPSDCLTLSWPGHTDWHQQNQLAREPHGNRCCSGYTAAVFESPAGGNDLIQSGLIQEAVFAACLKTHQSVWPPENAELFLNQRKRWLCTGVDYRLGVQGCF